MVRSGALIILSAASRRCMPPIARSRALGCNPVIRVFLDEDGRYYTNHPLLQGRFANRKQIGDRIRTVKQLFGFNYVTRKIKWLCNVEHQESYERNGMLVV